MAAVIGALRVDLGLNSAEFEQGMERAKKSANGMSSGVKTAFVAVAAAAAAMTAAFGLAVKGQIDVADGLSKSAASIGVSVKQLSALRYAADLSGVSTEDLDTAVGRLSRAMTEMASGASSAATKALDRLGVSAKNSDGSLRGSIDVMGDISERFASMPAGAEKTALAIELFGRSGAKLIPLLNAGKSGLAEMTAEAERLGLVIGTETALAAEKFNDNLTRLQSVGTGLANVAMAALLPALVGITDALVAFSQNGEAVASVLSSIGRVAAVAGAALLTAMSPAIWASISTAAFTMSGTVVGAIKAIGIAIAANPIGLIVTALVAAVTAAFVFRDEIKQAIGIDFVGIVKGAANNVIGLFVGAFKAVTAAWGMLPAAFGDIFTRAMNGSIEIVQNGVNGIIGALRNVPGLGGLVDADLSGFIREESGALDNIGGVVQSAFQEGFSKDYLGDLGKALGGVRTEAASTNEVLSALNETVTNTGVAAGGAGGAAQESLATALEAMRTALMTEEQAELASFAKRTEQIQAFYDQGLILKAEYDAMMEAAHQQHSDRMSQITQKQIEDEARIRSQLVGHAAGIFGSLSTIMENFGEENLGASKAFAVAAAVINTAEGITKALAQGGLLGFAGAAAVAAAGVAQISTIMSAKKGGSSRPTVGASAPSVQQGAGASKPSQAVSITLQGDYHPTQQVEELIGKLLDMQSDGHQIILTRP